MADTAPVLVIGAGPSGLATGRALDVEGIDWVGADLGPDVGGLWNIDAPRSTVYRSAHLISSRTTTELTEHPMPEGTPDYPDHRRLHAYFRSYAERFGLREHLRLGTEVTRVEPRGEGGDSGWVATLRSVADGSVEQLEASAVVIANGTLSEPRVPTFEGHFDGELRHTSRYKDPRIFEGKRVLVVGGGNSGCDIAVDAVHHADSVDISVRRGYHFVPKYIFGRPADTLNQGRPLPPRVKQAVDSRLLRLITGDPTRFGFPEPDHRIYESHPVVNSLILQHVGHGDIGVRADVERFDGSTVHFRDGVSGEYDIVMLATGYVLHYPFVDRRHLGWAEGQAAPDLYLNIVPDERSDLFVVGLVESSGLGWQGRYEQGELVARYLSAHRAGRPEAETFDATRRGPRPDLSGGYHYLALDRMAYYVNRTAYRDAVAAASGSLRPGAAETPRRRGLPWTSTT